MTRAFRRYEVLLPLKFNDGQPIAQELIQAAVQEVRSRFGAISVETQTIHGTGTYQERSYDDLVRIFVDVTDEEDSRQFFVQFKERLKQRFGQWDIWITTHPIDVI